MLNEWDTLHYYIIFALIAFYTVRQLYQSNNDDDDHG